jgi:hypothetical protein
MHLSAALPEFQTGQIIYLSYENSPHENSRLYAEAIQIVHSRQLCWARPLALHQLEPERIYDLRQGSDLLLPRSLFLSALDTDVIPVITQLHATSEPDQPDIARRQAHLLLQDFIRQVCRAYPEQFSA